jgi:hypothetical protein
MKRVLIITYYWPPSGGAGVQRWLGFVKHLIGSDYEPVIYTPENPDSSIEDLSLLDELPNGLTVIKNPIWEPYSYYKRLIGQNKNEKINTGFLTEKKKPGLIEDFAIWVRGNFFIPDARKFWIKPSINYLRKIIETQKIDLVISTGPPHSMHLIGLGLKQKTGVKWIADFRDPWTNIDFYDQLKLTSRSDRKHKVLENKVLKNADMVIAVGKTLGDELSDLGANNIRVITNGFDGEILESVQPKGKFTIGHFGSFVATRNPSVLWQTLQEIGNENPSFLEDLQIELVGKVDLSILDDIEKNNLSKNSIRVGQLAYKEALKKMESCQVLLLVANNTPNAKGILTSKMFEYMRTSRPILAIGPTESDMSEVMKEVYSTPAIDYKDFERMKQEVMRLYTLYKSGNLTVDASKTKRFHRSELTRKLINAMDETLIN